MSLSIRVQGSVATTIQNTSSQPVSVKVVSSNPLSEDAAQQRQLRFRAWRHC